MSRLLRELLSGLLSSSVLSSSRSLTSRLLSRGSLSSGSLSSRPLNREKLLSGLLSEMQSELLNGETNRLYHGLLGGLLSILFNIFDSRIYAPYLTTFTARVSITGDQRRIKDRTAGQRKSIPRN